MPRKKVAKPEEIVRVLTRSLQKLVDAVLNPRSRKNLQRHAEALALEWRVCQFVLTHQKGKAGLSKEQLAEVTHVNPAKIRKTVSGLRVTVEDLDRFELLANHAVSVMIGTESPAPPTTLLVRLLERLGQEPSVKAHTFKPEHLEAFRALQQARSEGRTLTRKALAEKFTPEMFQRNPESAIRGMGRAIKRVKREQQRLKPFGIPFPSTT